ncbi:xanthine dehydrogenase family protein molybdopterin-binding subunit, partial [Roseateles sp. GG27B]
KRYDAAKALAVPGVLQVIELKSTPLPAAMHPLGGVAVVAKNTWAAMNGREALVLEWDDGVHASYNSVAYKAELEAVARQPAK